MLWAYRGSWIFALGDESSNARFMSEGWTLWISHEPFCYSEEELGSCSCLVARTVGQRMWNLSKCEEQLFIDIVTSVVMAWCTLKRDTCRLCQLVHFKDPCWWPLQHRRRWMCSAVCLQDMVYLNNMSPTPDHNSFHQTLKGSWKRIELEPHCITLPQMEKQKDLFKCQTLFAINGSGSMSTKLSTILITYRNTPSSTAGVSPCMKRLLHTRLDLLLPSVQKRVQEKQADQNCYHDSHSRAETHWVQ